MTNLNFQRLAFEPIKPIKNKAVILNELEEA